MNQCEKAEPDRVGPEDSPLQPGRHGPDLPTTVTAVPFSGGGQAGQAAQAVVVGFQIFGQFARCEQAKFVGALGSQRIGPAVVLFAALIRGGFQGRMQSDFHRIGWLTVAEKQADQGHVDFARMGRAVKTGRIMHFELLHAAVKLFGKNLLYTGQDPGPRRIASKQRGAKKRPFLGYPDYMNLVSGQEVEG